MKNLIFLLITSVLLIAASCEKEELGPESELPPATRSGENTFGCLINGKPWVAYIDPKVFDPIIRKLSVDYDEEDTGVSDNFYLSIWATRLSYVDSLHDDLTLNLRPVYSKGKIEFNKLERNDIRFATSKADGLGRDLRIFELDTIYPVNIEITTLDAEKNYVSGTFDFRMIHTASSDTLTFTKGRFDVKYQPQ
jgi:hypothetical protein